MQLQLNSPSGELKPLWGMEITMINYHSRMGMWRNNYRKKGHRKDTAVGLVAIAAGIFLLIDSTIKVFGSQELMCSETSITGKTTNTQSKQKPELVT